MKRVERLFNDKLKLLALSFLFLFTLGILLPQVSSATGLFTNTTLNDSKVSGTYLIYVNISECANNCYIGNVTFTWIWYNGTSTILSTVNNVSGNQSVFSYSWDTTAFDDANNGTLNFSARNYTGWASTSPPNASNWTQGLDIDNGFPTATLSSSTFSSVSQGYNINKGTSFTLGIDADNTIGITSCSIYATDLQNSSVLSSTISTSSNACSNATLKPESFLVKGRAYNLLVQATDGNGNSTNSSTRRLNYLHATAGSSGSSSGLSSVTAGISQSFFGSIGKGTTNFFSSIGKGFSSLFKKITFWTDKY